ncbi:MAG: VOC family protein [Acidobacteria bacterium]|nr:VOC family protein [Acidobacteriota bacterium]MCB9398878.1 VOC family protein [Acidobacteriota bacterium]
MRPFHLAFPVHDLKAAKDFYCQILGCGTGRESPEWVDFNFFGHQITAHLANTENGVATNPVDGQAIPIRHFGIILTMQDWQALAKHLETLNIDFKVKPQIRFRGMAGEQATLFIADPSGNYLEFKAFNDDRSIFAPEPK